MVNLPALTDSVGLQVPTGTLSDVVPNLNLKMPLTPAPLAALQICSRPIGIGVDVGGLGVRVCEGVAVAVRMALFSKVIVVTPLPILATASPCALSALIFAEIGRMTMSET